MLDVAGLGKTDDGKGSSVEALRDLTGTVDEGELVCLVGPSGFGETTLIRCTAGLMQPSRGEVRLAGSRVYAQIQHAKSPTGAPGPASVEAPPVPAAVR